MIIQWNQIQLIKNKKAAPKAGQSSFFSKPTIA
jgi:hypothetical protein